MKPITVAIADRTRACRVACFESLQRDRDISVVAGVNERFELVQIGMSLRPAVVVCGMSLASEFGHWLLRTLGRECPATRVLLITDAAPSEADIAKSLALGSSAFVARALVQRLLPLAIHSMNRGEAWVPRRVLGRFAEQILE